MPLSFKQAIDGGTISFEDGRKPAEEYAPARKVRVELTFTTADGGQENADEIVTQIGDLAKAQVARLLGITSGTTASQPEAGEPASPPATRTRRTKAQIAADEAAKTAGGTTGSSPEAPSGGEPTGDGDFDPLAETPASEPEGGDDPAGIEDLSEFDVQPDATETKAVTDADLNSAVQKKNAEIANPDAIRGLIGGYNPDPTQVFQLRQIPADKRAEFLTKLAALTKAA